VEFIVKNNVIAVPPMPEQKTLTKQKVGGMVVFEQSVSLVKVPILFGNSEYPRGEFAFLKGNAAVQAWARTVYEYEGTKFILVPTTEVIMVTKSNKS
jgi:hypothetical protein